MKKIKISLVAIAFLIGIAMAFAFKPVETKTTGQSGTSLYWFNPAVSGYMGANTISDEETETGCVFQGPECERGYSSSQLNNPADPSQGVKTSEIDNPQHILYKE